MKVDKDKFEEFLTRNNDLILEGLANKKRELNRNLTEEEVEEFIRFFYKHDCIINDTIEQMEREGCHSRTDIFGKE